MEIQKTPLKDCFIFIPKVFEDQRGFFFESFNQNTFERLCKQPLSFKQDNTSFSYYGVIRGLHAQSGTSSQAKIVSVLQGEVLDVVVDIRPNSPTFGEKYSIHLSAKTHRQLFIPKGFLHGFSTLSKTALFSYKCDEFYDKHSEIGVRYNDPDLMIDWKIPEKDHILSAKDLALPYFKNLKL